MPQHLVFLDANFLLIPVQFQVDIYQEFDQLLPHPYKLIVLKPIIKELKQKLHREPTQKKLKQQIRLALQILDKSPCQIREVPFSKNTHVDDFLIEITRNHQTKFPNDKVYLASNDKELRQKASNAHIRTVYLRKKRYLAVNINN
mgnify:CR=1 FL=1